MATSSSTILLLIPNLGLGGAQRVFHDHSVELAKRYQVAEAVFNLDDGNLFPSANPVHSLAVAGGGGATDKIRNFWRRVVRLRKLKKQLHTTVCISHLEGADYVNLLSKGTEKTVLCIHGSKLHDANISGPVGWLRKKILMPALYNRADRIVTVSRDIMPELVESFGVKPEKLLTINNFFEVAQIQEKSREPLAPAEQALYEQGPVLITAGRLAPQKNQAPLLDVFAAVRQQYPTTRLLFVGDGELRAELVAHARALGLRVYASWEGTGPLEPGYEVYFLGLQPNPFKYLRRATAFVFPSAWEGFPLALGEAMCCSLPVLSSDCPTGPREMLAPDTATPKLPLRQAEHGAYGVLLPTLTQALTAATDQHAWVQAISDLLGNPAEQTRLGELAKRRMQDFTREKIFSQWLKLIDELTSYAVAD
jgi:glycosyltransferase involved in cell wall biosynthesis